MEQVINANRCGVKSCLKTFKIKGKIGISPCHFPVKLHDDSTIIAEDRSFDVTIEPAAGGPGLGTVGVTNQQLDHGTITFQESYTRAGNVFVTVTTSKWS